MSNKNCLNVLFITCSLFLAVCSSYAAENTDQRIPAGINVAPLAEGPFIYDTAEGHTIKVSVIARGLDHPFGIVFLPDGSKLVTEKNTGHIRRISNDRLESEPVATVADIVVQKYTGLLDIALHPDFPSEPYIYLSYNKALPDDKTAVTYARGEWDGNNINNIQDIFIAQEGTTNGSRIIFDNQGMMFVGIYVTTDMPRSLAMDQHKGKLLRLTPEGEIPEDNPFAGNPEFLPEIWSYGHRTITGMTLHPETGEIWASEMGPNGGDEVNIIRQGGNYGWPLISLGRSYQGPWYSESFQMKNVIDPEIFWMPSISNTGLTFYTGDDFPFWQGDLFVGGMKKGEIDGTGELQRIKFNDNMEEIRRESLLADLRQRIRDVKQGPDGMIYLLTDEDDGAVLRIEPLN